MKLRHVFAASALPLVTLLAMTPADASTSPAPGLCPPKGCPGAGGDPPPAPPPPPSRPAVRSVQTTNRVVAIPQSHRVYGQTEQRLFRDGVQRLRVTMASTYGGRVVNVRFDTPWASAACMWDGHAGAGVPAIASTREWRNGHLVTNHAELIGQQVNFLSDCTPALGAAFRDGGVTSDDLKYVQNVIDQENRTRSITGTQYNSPPGPMSAGRPGTMSALSVSGGGTPIIGGGVPWTASDEDKARRGAIITAVGTQVGGWFLATLSGAVAAPEEGAAALLGAGLAAGITFYELAKLNASDPAQGYGTQPTLPEGGVDGVQSVTGWDDDRDYNKGDGGSGPGSEDPGSDPSGPDSLNGSTPDDSPGSTPWGDVPPPGPGGCSEMPALWCEGEAH